MTGRVETKIYENSHSVSVTTGPEPGTVTIEFEQGHPATTHTQIIVTGGSKLTEIREMTP